MDLRTRGLHCAPRRRADGTLLLRRVTIRVEPTTVRATGRRHLLSSSLRPKIPSSLRPFHPHHLHDDRSCSWSGIEIDQHDLLPCPQRQSAVDHRNLKRRPEQ